MEPVRSTRNPRVSEAVRLHRARDRRELGLTLLEGPHLVSEAVGAGAGVREIFGIGEPPFDIGSARWIEVTEPVLERLSGTRSPRGPIAVMRIPDSPPPTRDHLTLDIADPGNAGTLIRTSAAFGLDVVFRSGAVDPWAPKVLRAAAGAHFRTTVALRPAPDAGTIATVVEGGIAPRGLGEVLDPGRMWSVLVGSEPHGLDAVEAASADFRVSVPMPGGTESLNAAVAGSIVAYELALWRNPG